MAEGKPVVGMSAPSRSPRAFADIFDTYHLRILRHLSALVRDPALAEDLAQETFVKAYQALARTALQNLSAWLYAIATNTALAALRRRRILALLPFGAVQPGVEERIDDTSQQLSDRDLLRLALDRLPRRDASCLLLHFQQGLSHAELADVLDVSVPAAKMRLSRARAAFREVYLSLSEEANR